MRWGETTLLRTSTEPWGSSRATAPPEWSPTLPRGDAQTERWFAIEADETYEINETSPDGVGAADINSFNSFDSEDTDESGWGKVS